MVRILALLLLSSLGVQAQPDSLIQKLNEAENDTQRAYAIYDISVKTYQSEPKISRVFGDSALKLFKSLGMNEMAGRASSHMGILFKNTGEFEKAISYQIDALKYSEMTGDVRSVAVACNNIGILYKTLARFDEALPYYRRSLAACLEMGFPRGVAMCLSNIGTIHDAKQNLDSAVVYYQFALDTATKYDIVGAKAVALNNLGEIYAKQDKEEIALPYFYRVLELDQESGDKHGEVYSLINVGNSLKVLKRFDEAVPYFEKALSQSKELGANNLENLVYHSMADYYGEKGDFKSAFEYHQKHIQLKDSIYNLEKMAQLEELKTKYETEKKEQENVQLRNEAEIKELKIDQQSLQITALIVLLAALTIITLLWINRQKHKAQVRVREARIEEQKQGLNAVITAVEEERKRIAKDLHDGIGQQLSGLRLSWSKLARKFAKDGEDGELNKLTDILDGTANNLRSISHEMMPRVLSEAGLVPAIEDMLEKSFALSDVKYSYEHFGMDSRFNERLEISLYRVCQELINNIIKHSGASEVSVQLIYSGTNLALIVEDNGRGFDVTKSGDGIGLMNISSRVSNINGEINYEPSPGSGTVATIRIPVSKVS